MDDLLASLGHTSRLAIVEYLLGLDTTHENPAPRPATHSEIRAQFGINGGTLTKDLARLRRVGLLAESPGTRRDQPVLEIRRADLLYDLLVSAASLDAALAADIATMHRVEADMKADRESRVRSARSRLRQ